MFVSQVVIMFVQLSLDVYLIVTHYLWWNRYIHCGGCLCITDVPPALNVDKAHITECLLEMFTDMFGSDSVSKLIKGDRLTINIDDLVAIINIDTLVNIDHRKIQVIYFKNLHAAVFPLIIYFHQVMGAPTVYQPSRSQSGRPSDLLKSTPLWL